MDLSGWYLEKQFMSSYDEEDCIFERTYNVKETFRSYFQKNLKFLDYIHIYSY